MPAVLETLRDDVLPVYQRRGRTQEGWETTDSCHLAPPPAAHTLSAEHAADAELLWRESDPNPSPDLLTDEEAFVLFECGYELLGDPVPPGQERFFVWRPEEGHPSHAGPRDTYEDYDTLHAYVTNLNQALLSWATAFNLADDWILGSARRQLAVWDQYWFLAYPQCKWPRASMILPAQDQREGPARNPALVGTVYLTWLPVHQVTWFSPTASRERQLSFLHPGWETTMERRAMAKARIMADFARFLDTYLDGMEALTTRNRHDCLRPPGYATLSQYLEWVVRYQCLKESYAQIAASLYGHNTADPRYQTVAGPALRLMKLMGLTPRKAHRGRPKGVRERYARHRVD